MSWILSDLNTSSAGMKSYECRSVNANISINLYLDHNGHTIIVINPYDVHTQGVNNSSFQKKLISELIRNDTPVVSDFFEPHDKQVITNYKQNGSNSLLQVYKKIEEQELASYKKYMPNIMTPHLKKFQIHMYIYDDTLIESMFECMKQVDELPDDTRTYIEMLLLKVRRPFEYHVRCNDYASAFTAAVKTDQLIELGNFYKNNKTSTESLIGQFNLSKQALEAYSSISYEHKDYIEATRAILELLDFHLALLTSYEETSLDLKNEIREEMQEMENIFLERLLSLGENRREQDKIRLGLLSAHMVPGVDKDMIAATADNHRDLHLRLLKDNVALQKHIKSQQVQSPSTIFHHKLKSCNTPTLLDSNADEAQKEPTQAPMEQKIRPRSLTI